MTNNDLDQHVGFRMQSDEYQEFKDICKEKGVQPSLVLRLLVRNFNDDPDISKLFDN